MSWLDWLRRRIPETSPPPPIDEPPIGPIDEKNAPIIILGLLRQWEDPKYPGLNHYEQLKNKATTFLNDLYNADINKAKVEIKEENVEQLLSVVAGQLVKNITEDHAVIGGAKITKLEMIWKKQVHEIWQAVDSCLDKELHNIKADFEDFERSGRRERNRDDLTPPTK